MQMRLREMAFRLKLEPFTVHLRHTIDQLQLADTAHIFGRPVTLQEVGYCRSVCIVFSLYFTIVSEQ